MMRTEKSLHQVMNEMISHPGRHSKACLRAADESKSSHRIADAYACFDPVLADLQKRHLDAEQHYLSLLSERGPDDPLAEVAADMRACTGKAVRTRLKELRLLRKMRKKAQRKMCDFRDQRESCEEDRYDIQMKASAAYREKLEQFNLTELRKKEAVDRRKENHAFIVWVAIEVLRDTFIRSHVLPRKEGSITHRFAEVSAI